VFAAITSTLAVIRCRWVTWSATKMFAWVSQPQLQGVAFLALAVGFVFWWVQQSLNQIPDGSDMLTVRLEVDPSQLEEVSRLHATTDQGRPVTVYTLPTPVPRSDLAEAEKRMVVEHQMAQKQIRTAGPDNNYNCHGWVFTGGRYWIRGNDVPAILDDNDYRPVSAPIAGDVIVYRNEQDAVLHTGLVHSVAADGLILIESKWGWMGRYIHKPEDQTYGNRWTYYHSDRGLNGLHGLNSTVHSLDGLTE
jgi:hypothetical protein